MAPGRGGFIGEAVGVGVARTLGNGTDVTGSPGGRVAASGFHGGLSCARGKGETPGWLGFRRRGHGCFIGGVLGFWARTPKKDGGDVMVAERGYVAASRAPRLGFSRARAGRARAAGIVADRGGRRGHQQGRWPAGDVLCALSRSAAAKAGARRGCGRRKVKLTGGTRLSVTLR